MKYKLLIYGIMAAMAFCTTSCYSDFDEPAPAKVWTDADFTTDGGEIITIKALKDMCAGVGLAQYKEITDNYIIKGKVISSDQAGNVYKSVYIDDGTAGIELKLMVSNYVYYQVGQTLYVKLKGLAIGNYRYMLSVGGIPSEKDIAKNYANRNLDTQVERDAHIFMGELGQLTEENLPVITRENYKTTLTDEYLGRLVRFEGLTYKEGNFDGDRYPQYLETVYLNNATEATYTNKYFKDEGLTPTYAYNYQNQRYYGSSLFTYDATDETDKKGNLIVRVSGYANFALDALPQNGATGAITAIYTKYSSKSGGYIKYQLLVNKRSDIEF
ncbi:DUF5689 domain-containing protein [Phocaeicola sp. ICN-14070]|jgi:hypothetical protein|uniref:DUF5689 domain-containing protein n=1 Tax=Phocaeicola sp. ICN-14070 TaxID=3134656 RepID=UPI0030BAC727